MSQNAPLAEKIRPKTLDDFFGQEHILGKDKLLRRIIESDRIIPMIFWGPPGCGKTTLASIIAQKTKSYFVFFSAVSSGVADVRRIIAEAKERITTTGGQRTILFIDEIHRFNKSQQDAFLPFVENGTIILLGATTENPSFEVNAPLLSRARVFHFRELDTEDVKRLIIKTIQVINKDSKEFFNHPVPEISITNDALSHISETTEGDARDALNALELAIIAANHKNNKITIDKKLAEESIQRKFIRYDKGSDGHFDAISALHKSLRSSDVNASLHYTARMLEAGEDPLYIIRRLVRFSAEDIGLADPFALVLASSVQSAVHFVGMPESNDIIAELVIYLALAPKSRSCDEAYSKARNDVVNRRLDPIPLEIRNAPTKLMRDFGFGQGYKMYTNQSRMPENLKKEKYWQDSNKN